MYSELRKWLKFRCCLRRLPEFGQCHSKRMESPVHLSKFLSVTVTLQSRRAALRNPVGSMFTE